jgi:hypothetical protein
MKKTPTEWVQSKIVKLRKKRDVLDKYRIDVLEGIDDDEPYYFEECLRLTGAIDILTEMEKALQKKRIGAIV